ncbi:hypothetical protein PM082_004424 [Marasmius tenuissimus]|nr:hypothetical protein PM082_004424 [Marasmius tenuissimus]
MNSSSQDGIKQALAPVFEGHAVIVSPISTLSVMFLVYGIYLVVFGLSIHVLCRPDRPNSSKLYLGCTISLFVLATAFVISTGWSAIRQTIICYDAIKTNNYIPLLEYLKGDSLKATLFAVPNIVFALMNALADVMLIHRCYIVWGSKMFMLYLFVLIAFIINTLSLASVIIGVLRLIDTSNPAYIALYQKARNINDGTMIAAAAFSFFLTILTGGRIWWISREARQMMGESTNKRYTAIVATLVESGVLYTTTLLVAVLVPILLNYNQPTHIIPINLGVISTLMAGLGPTLIIVRVAYGKATESVQQVVSTLQFADRDDRNRIASGIHTVDLHSRIRSSEPNVNREVVEEKSV